jgi:hypothetical protein
LENLKGRYNFGGIRVDGINFKEKVYGDVELIRLTERVVQWWTVENAITNYPVP